MKRSIPFGVLLFLAAVLVLHGPVLFGKGVRLALDQRAYPPWRSAVTEGIPPTPASPPYNRLSTDSNFWYEGQILLARRLVRRRGWPTWEPWTQAGTPLEAQLGAPPCYPPFWLLFLVDPMRGVGWLAAFHMFLAAWFAARLVRFLGGSRAAAFLAGTAFGLGPWMAFRENNMTILAAAAWAPLAFEAAGRLVAEGASRKWILLLVLSLAAGLAAGMPQLGFVSLWGALAFAAFGLFRISENKEKKALFAGWVFLAGLLLAAPTLLPTFRLYRNSIRTSPEVAPQRFSLRPGALLGILSPEILGSPVETAGWERVEDFPPARKLLSGHPQDNPLENCLYPGAAVLLLLLLLLLGPARRSSSREGRSLWGPGFFLGLAGTALLLSFRPSILEFLYALPGLGPEDPRRILLLYHLGLAGAAGLTLDRLEGTRLPRRLLLPVLFLPLLPAAAGWILPEAGESLLRSLFPGLTGGEIQRLLFYERAALLRPALFAAAAAGALLLLPRFRRTAKPLLVGGLLLECLAFGLRINPTPPMAQVRALGKTRTEKVLLNLVRRAGPEGPPRLLHVKCFHALQGNLLAPQGIPVISATHPLPSARLCARMRLVERTLVDPALPRGIAWLRDPRSALHPLLRSARIGLFCCADSDTAARLESLGLERIFPPPGEEAANEGVALFRNPGVGPRARLVFSWKRVVSAEEAERVLAKGEGPVPLETKGPLPPPLRPTGRPRIRWLLSRPGRILLDVDTRGGRGVLVVADTFYPGWSALVDGEPAPLFPADLAFLGLYLEPGRHRVDLSFTDPDRWTRILLLAAGLGLTVFLILLAGGTSSGKEDLP